MSTRTRVSKSNNMQGKLSPSAKAELDLMQGTVFVGGESLGTDPDKKKKKKKKKGKNMKKSVTPNALKLGYLELFAKSGSPPRPTDLELFEIIEDYGDFKFGKERSLQKSEWVFFSYNEQGGRWNGKNLVRLVKSMLMKAAVGGRGLTATQIKDYESRDRPRPYKGPEGKRSALSPSAPLFEFDTTSGTRHPERGESVKRMEPLTRLNPTQDTPEELKRDAMTPAQRAELRTANIAESTADKKASDTYAAGAGKRAAAVRADRRGSAKLQAAETVGLRVRGPYQSGIHPDDKEYVEGQMAGEMGTPERSKRVREALYDGKVESEAADMAEDRLKEPGKYGRSRFGKELTEELADIGKPPSKREPGIGQGGGRPVATYKEGGKWFSFVPKKVTDGKTTLGELQDDDDDADEADREAKIADAKEKQETEGKVEVNPSSKEEPKPGSVPPIFPIRPMSDYLNNPSSKKFAQKLEKLNADKRVAAITSSNPFAGTNKSFTSMENTPFPFKMYPQPMQSSLGKSQSTYRSDDYLIELLAKEIGIPRYEVERRVARVDQPLRKSGT